MQQKAKSLLWQISAPGSDCPVCKGDNVLSSHFSDIITVLRSLDSSNTFCTYIWDKATNRGASLPVTVYTSLLSKLNELQQVVVEMSGKLDNY